MTKIKYENYSKQELIKEIKKLKRRKTYGIVWEEQVEKVVELCKEKLPVLKEIENKEVKMDENLPTNILIEGDNYHVLSVLNYTHKRKIDVIYIDPPYNTGAKNWKYNNDYVDKLDLWRHSKWLSFMNKRLRLAKRLLSPKGVLICAIDHNEREGLGLLLQEIFPSKEITCVTIIHNPRGIQGKNFSYCHEYTYFVYPKTGVVIGRRRRSKDKQEYSNLRKWGGLSKRSDGKSLFYPIYVKDEEIIKIGDPPSDSFHPSKSYTKLKDGTIEFWPIDNKGIERKWRYSKKTLEKIRHLIKVNDVGGVFQIQILKTEDRYRTVWIDKKYDANIYGTQLVRNILGKEFPYPKSLYNVKECLDAVAINNSNATILDFFAGSGTTGHAVLEMNKEDGGNRKFILCTNNENEICTEVCYPRIKKVMKGYKNLKGRKIKGLGGNLKYFKTAFVDATLTDQNKKKLVDKSTEMLCLKENCFDEVKGGRHFKIFNNPQDKYLGIIYDDGGIEPFKKKVKKINKKFVVYVFSLDESAREEEFEDVIELVNLKPIPEVILNVYRRIFK